MKLGQKTAVFFTQHIVEPVKAFFSKFGRNVEKLNDVKPKTPQKDNSQPSKPKRSLFSRLITKLNKQNPNFHYAQAQNSLRYLVNSCAKNEPENAIKALVRLGKDMNNWHVAKTGKAPDGDQFGDITSELVSSDWLQEEQSEGFSNQLRPGGMAYNIMTAMMYTMYGQDENGSTMRSNVPGDTFYNLTNLPRIMDAMVEKFLPDELDTIREAYTNDSDPDITVLDESLIRHAYKLLKDT